MFLASSLSHTWLAGALCLLVIQINAIGISAPSISRLSPQGIQFSLKDVPGATLAAFHYSVNKELCGIAAGDWNVDIRTTTGGLWIHENTAIKINPGDVVNYWVYLLIDGLGYQLTDMRWIAPEGGALHAQSWGSLREPIISLLSPTGIQFTLKDVPGATLAAFHYSVNTVLPGVAAGTWNFDVTSKNNGSWIHKNMDLKVNVGDTVNYWVYMIINGRGYQITDRSWAVAALNPESNGDLPGLKLVFSDDFSSLNSSKWDFDITLSGGGNWEFQAYTDLPETCFTRDGKLFIKPIPTAQRYGEEFLTAGIWDMINFYGRCTDDQFFGCRREGQFGFLNPVLSAKLRSKASIKFGKVEIIAKMPRGDWLWPALWMLPKDSKYGGWPRSGEIDICEARGNRQFGTIGVEQMGSTLHWGTDPGNNRWSMTTRDKKARSRTLADGMHSYVLDWDENKMAIYLDGDLVVQFNTPMEGWFKWGQLPGDNIWPSSSAPFDQEFYLIMNVAVGGTNGYFPDDLVNEGYTKPWRNSDAHAPRKFWEANNFWLPTWQGDDAAMQVESVKMWQKI